MSFPARLNARSRVRSITKGPGRPKADGSIPAGGATEAVPWPCTASPAW